MICDSATARYLIAQPFDQAVKLVRQSLSRARVTISREANLSAWIHKRLLISTPPCLVLFASSSSPVIEIGDTEPLEAALIPLHVIVSAQGSQTEIHVLRALPCADRLEGAGTDKFVLLQKAVSQAIEQIGIRVGLGA